MKQYFRVKMLRSWALQLRECPLPQAWERVTAVAEGDKECYVIVQTEERKPIRPVSVTLTLRAALDDFDGYMLVEAISQQEAQKIMEAK